MTNPQLAVLSTEMIPFNLLLVTVPDGKIYFHSVDTRGSMVNVEYPTVWSSAWAYVCEIDVACEITM